MTDNQYLTDLASRMARLEDKVDTILNRMGILETNLRTDQKTIAMDLSERAAEAKLSINSLEARVVRGEKMAGMIYSAIFGSGGIAVFLVAAKTFFPHLIF